MNLHNKRSWSWMLVGFLGGILVSLGIAAAAQKSEPLPLKALQQFANVYGAIKSSYVEPVTDQTLIDNAIKGLFADLDPHSLYLDPEAYKQMQDITRGGFGGLGIEIGTQDGHPKVIAPIEDTPAARAGILTGDLITHIDGEPTKGMTLNDAVKKMRGDPGTPIDLTIQRAGSSKPLKFHIVREMIKTRSVRGKMLDDDIVYVRVTQFQDRTTGDLVRMLNQLAGKKAPKGLVLDLRNDPGGLLDGAIGVSSVFIEPGKLVVSTKGRIPSSNEEFHARPLDRDGVGDLLPSWTRTVPMVVLVNIGSASASEIVAGALQDYKRAKIVGNRTFGKGSVQSVLQLDDETGLKLTTARYYTPKGRSIQNTGVKPDYVVDDSAAGNLFRLEREVDLKHHLVASDNDTIEAAPEAEDDDFVQGEIQMFEFGGADDWQLQQGLNVLHGRPVHKSDPQRVRLERAQAEGADGSSANATTPAAQPASAEKKTLNDAGEPVEIRRYRITPEGMFQVP